MRKKEKRAAVVVITTALMKPELSVAAHNRIIRMAQTAVQVPKVVGRVEAVVAIPESLAGG